MEFADSAPQALARAAFHIPAGMRYFDGNSLGLMPKAVREEALNVVGQEWADGLIRSWQQADWQNLPARAGARIAALIGAAAHEVIACDSTSVNLYKVLVSAIRLNPGRKRIVTDADAFPTDLYIAAEVARLFGMTVQAVPAARIPQVLDRDVAVVLLTHVDYRSARIYDMDQYTEAAHGHGALIVWDLSHTAGALPCDLAGSGADFAVGCGYKYLNGGPGAPAYLYAAARHAGRCEQPLAGWFGHARPFEFTPDYQPAPGLARFLCGTNPVVGLSLLLRALDVFEGVSMDALRRRSIALSEAFIAGVDARLERHGFVVASPRDPMLRGSHVSLRHPQGYAVMQELASRKIIGDFRAPDYMRFGFAPLYNTAEDIEALLDALDDIMTRGSWDRLEYRERRAFT